MNETQKKFLTVAAVVAAVLILAVLYNRVFGVATWGKVY